MPRIPGLITGVTSRAAEMVLEQRGAKRGPDVGQPAPRSPACEPGVSAGIPLPPGYVTEHQFLPPRKWRFDYCWPAQRIALEIEGGAWTGGRHTRPKGFIRDLEKYNAAALAGWLLLRVTPQQLRDGEAAVLVVRAMKTRTTEGDA